MRRNLKILSRVMAFKGWEFQNAFYLEDCGLVDIQYLIFGEIA